MRNLLEIKICGINDELCMKTAIDNGVDYIGLVFYDKSPRNIKIPFARKLIKYRNKISKIVALTVNADDNFLFEIKNNINPDYIQLHGDETPDRCRYIRKNLNIPVIKGLGIDNSLDLNNFSKQFKDICDILILDAPSKELPGGNGKKFDWKILNNYKSKKKWMLAGGLNIHNISEAISVTKPNGVDISSGLEKVKGVKDPQLIKDFVLKCRNF